MKHVAMIMAHENPLQVEVLVNELTKAGWETVIHIDKNMPLQDYTKLHNRLISDHVRFIERKRVSWGSYLQIETELRLLETAILWNADYYHLLSGADLPIKSLHTFDAFVCKHSGKEFVQVIPDWADTDGVKDRFAVYHYFQHRIGRKRNLLWVVNKLLILFQRCLKVNRLKHLDETKFYGGMNWFSITHDFGQYVLTKEEWIRSTFSYGLCVDEVFLQTLLMNSPFAQRRYIHNEPYSMCSSLRYVDWVRGKPYTWSYTDYEELISNSNYFARKFSYRTEEEIGLTNRILKNNNE